MLKHYANLSVSNEFEYGTGKAGDRPEILELAMRGDISKFDRRIDQEINTILNKCTTEELAKKLVTVLLN